MVSLRATFLAACACSTLAVGWGPAAPSPEIAALPYRLELTPLEERMLADADDGRLDDFSLFAAGLIAGGTTDDAQLDDALRHFNLLRGELIERLSAGLDTPEVAQRTLQFLHDEVLRDYDLHANDLRQTLDQGRFNCITAVLLFNALAAASRLNAIAVETPGHVMSRIQASAGKLDIEATLPPDSSTLSASYHPPKPSGPGRSLTPLGLIALVYYNRGLDLLEQGEFEAAAGANCVALRLDPQSTRATDNLLAVLNNWALACHADQDFQSAYELLERAGRLAPHDRRPTENARAVVGSWIEHLCATERYDAALGVIERAAVELPLDDDVCRAARFHIYRTRLTALLAVESLDSAVRTCDAWRHTLGDRASLDEAEVAAWSDHATQLLAAGCTVEARAALRIATRRYPANRLLREKLHAAERTGSSDLSARAATAGFESAGGF